MERLLRLGIPFIIYFVASLIFSLFVLGSAFSAITGGIALDNAVKTVIDLPLMLFGSCSFIFLFMWMKDREQNGFEGNEMPASAWLLLPVIGLLFAFGEIYVVRGMLNRELSEVFFGVSEYAMDAVKAVPTFFIAIFVLEPICFELLFRGLFHQRMREESGALPTIVIVGIVAAIFYRAVDSVIMALILSFIYEYYRNLAAPLIVSVCYSLGCYFFYSISLNLPGINGEMSILVPVFILLCAIGVIFLLFVIYRKHGSPYGSKW